jgi:hypothetical protein
MALTWFLVMVFANSHGMTTASLPMATEEACLNAAKVAADQFTVLTVECINYTSGNTLVVK